MGGNKISNRQGNALDSIFMALILLNAAINILREKKAELGSITLYNVLFTLLYMVYLGLICMYCKELQ